MAREALLEPVGREDTIEVAAHVPQDDPDAPLMMPVFACRRAHPDLTRTDQLDQPTRAHRARMTGPMAAPWGRTALTTIPLLFDDRLEEGTLAGRHRVLRQIHAEAGVLNLLSPTSS